MMVSPAAASPFAAIPSNSAWTVVTSLPPPTSQILGPPTAAAAVDDLDAVRAREEFVAVRRRDLPAIVGIVPHHDGRIGVERRVDAGSAVSVSSPPGR